MKMQEIFAGTMLRETSTFNVEVGPFAGTFRTIRVFKNPNKQAMRNILENGGCLRARMLLGLNGELFVWAARDAIHGHIGDAIGLNQCYRGFIYPDGIGLRYDQKVFDEYAPIVAAFPSVIAACGPNVQVFRTTDDW